ncbi:hypothetical protein BGZ89_004302, partial [Linnemannia elongata]
HFSTVTMDITQNTNSTGIKVTQEGVPIGDLDITRQNWSNYYWAEIKRTFGYVGLVTTSTTMSNDAKKSQSQSDKKQKRRRRTDSKKKRTTGGGAGAGVYTGAGLAVLTAFALGFCFGAGL